jgi:hypothetical protein
MEKSAAFQLGHDYGYLKAVTPGPQFFEKMAKKLDVHPMILMAVFNKQALEKTAGLPLALLAGGLLSAPDIYRWFKRRGASPYKYQGPLGRGIPDMSRIGGLDPKAMSDMMGYGAQMRALGAQNQMINRMFQPSPVY